MTGKEISVHHAKVYLAVKGTNGRWVTNPDLYEMVSGVAPTTIRLIMLDLYKRRLVERVEAHPLFRYRWSTRREGRDHDFETKMEAVCEAFGFKAAPNGKEVMPSEGD